MTRVKAVGFCAGEDLASYMTEFILPSAYLHSNKLFVLFCFFSTAKLYLVLLEAIKENKNLTKFFFFFLNYCLFCTFFSNCSSEREVAAPVCHLGWRRFCLPDSQVGVAEVEGWVLCQWGSCVNPLGHSGLWRFCGLPRLLSVWTVVMVLGILSVTVFKLIFPYAC